MFRNVYSVTSKVYSMNARLIQYFKIDVFHHIKKLKKKNYLFISFYAEKTFDTITNPFMIFKNIGKLEIERSFLT